MTSDFVIGISGSYDGSASDDDPKVCRICHFGSEDSSGLGHSSEIGSLGCECKGQLGSAHRNCAEIWFGHRENRLCEICGKTAKNVTVKSTEETSVFMMEWREMRAMTTTLDTSRESSRRCRRSCYNLVLACLVLAFVLPWFFRFDML